MHYTMSSKSLSNFMPVFNLHIGWKIRGKIAWSDLVQADIRVFLLSDHVMNISNSQTIKQNGARHIIMHSSVCINFITQINTVLEIFRSQALTFKLITKIFN